VIAGDRVRLRAWSDTDLPALTALRNDAALQSQLLARVRGSTPDQVRQWLQQRSAAPGGLLLVVASRDEDRPLGWVQLAGLDDIDRRAELGIGLAAEHRGAGLGGEALRLLLAHVRSSWPLRKIGLRVRADNRPALRCYEAAGFERCGLLRADAWADGAWRDVVLMECFLDA
jgi:RimJ/RimL family protein N-acetyltransferase